MMNTATFVRSLEDWHSDARLYALSAPLRSPLTSHEATYVIVSCLVSPAYDETSVFAADANGNPVADVEYPGSARMANVDHTSALATAGYAVA